MNLFVKSIITISAITLIIVSAVMWNVYSDINEIQNKNIKLLHMVFRHGISTPTDTYPNDPYINNTLYPTGWGQITNKAKRLLFEQGTYLRRRYAKFLGSYYSPNVFYVATHDDVKSKMSAQCINAGMWPPNSAQKWGPLKWQPVSIETTDLLLVKDSCLRYLVELENAQNRSDVQHQLTLHHDLFTNLSLHAGMEITIDNVQQLFTILQAEEESSFPLPKWARKLDEEINDAVVFHHRLRTQTDDLIKLQGGVFLKKLLDDWTDAAGSVLKPNERKAFLYVGDDTAIINILTALKIWDDQMPSFFTNVLFEFSQRDDSEYGVEIFLRNATDMYETPYQLTIPHCDPFCPLSKLLNLTEAVVPGDSDQECDLEET